MIIVCGLRQAQEQIDLHGARSVIGILSPETQHPVYRGISDSQHLRLSFSDINEETAGLTAATLGDAQRLIDFIRDWKRNDALLVHCWAGISRSTATAFAAMCLLNPEVDEKVLAARLRAASASATPNKLITEKVDHLLRRDGRMVDAVASIGRGVNAYEGTPFKIDL